MSLNLNLYDKIDELQAKIQSKIADFLKCREKLVRARGKGDIQAQSEVNALLERQTQLETELSQVLVTLEKFKNSTWTIEHVTQASTFYYAIVQHINDTNSIDNKVKGVAQDGLLFGYPAWQVVAASIGILILVKIIK